MINRVRRIDDQVQVAHALVSVDDKSGLESLITGLLTTNPGITIYSTGGTFAKIEQILGARSTRHLKSVSEYTGQPEMQGGLVKTLDFKIYLGLLSETYNDAHARDLERVAGVRFDLVVSNLYPFSKAISTAGASCEDARANIDIGGPCMVRAAAKNFLRVAVVSDPKDYELLLDELRANDGATTLVTRFRLAQRAFARIAEYDSAISAYLSALDPASVEASYSFTQEPQ